MKLLLENWRKFLIERKLSDSGTPLLLPFRTDFKIYNDRTIRQYGVDGPIELNVILANDGVYHKGATKWYNNKVGQRSIYNMMLDSDAPRRARLDEEALKNSMALWIAIYGYVGVDLQPQSNEEIDFVRECFRSGVEGLSFYEGTAYRGMAVSEDWIYEQLFGQKDAYSYLKDERGPDDIKMGVKDYLNFYRLMKGQKVITPQTKSYQRYWEHKLKGENRAESWSRSEKVALNFGMYNLGGTIDGDDGTYLSIVMVADTKRNKDVFLNLDWMYKNTILKSEKGNKEVPAFVHQNEGIKVKKAIIPYRQIRKFFKDFVKNKRGSDKTRQAIQTGRIRPIQLEDKQNQNLLKEQKYNKLLNIEQDWEIVF